MLTVGGGYIDEYYGQNNPLFLRLLRWGLRRATVVCSRVVRRLQWPQCCGRPETVKTYSHKFTHYSTSTTSALLARCVPTHCGTVGTMHSDALRHYGLESEKHSNDIHRHVFNSFL